MIGLIQRVSGAEVAINGTIVAKIGTGLLVLAGIERHDGPEQAVKLAARLVAYRVFADAAGKMNRSVRDVGGALLLCGRFGADMKVTLTNDGPVTFWLQVPPGRPVA